MTKPSPAPLSDEERRARQRRSARAARAFGFVGRVEYRHVYTRSGGAQYGQGRTAADDLLTIFAEAFERDGDREDFSLEAIIAHECGHQMLVRHPRIAQRVAGRLTVETEEVLASLLGAMISPKAADRNALLGKAIVELLQYGESLEFAQGRVEELWKLFEAFL